jgi:putative transposase
MPVSKQKRIIPEYPLSTSEPSSPRLLEQQEFHQHLHALAQSAVRTVLELVMREELDTFIGAAWGESSPKRKGYRHSSYTRDLATSTGRIEDLKVPRDREGQFHTQTFERYSRYEPHIAEGRDGDVCRRNQHAQSRRRSSNPAGSRSQCQRDQSPEPEPDPTI